MATKNYILWQGLIMTVGTCLGGIFMKDPPKNWWPKEIDPLQWQKNSTRDLRNNPPALRHYNLGEISGARRRPSGSGSSTPCSSAARCSAWPTTIRSPSSRASARWPLVAGFAGFALTTALARPVYGYISEFIGRRWTMIYAYSGNVVFQCATYFAGIATTRRCS